MILKYIINKSGGPRSTERAAAAGDRRKRPKATATGRAEASDGGGPQLTLLHADALLHTNSKQLQITQTTPYNALPEGRLLPVYTLADVPSAKPEAETPQRAPGTARSRHCFTLSPSKLQTTTVTTTTAVIRIHPSVLQTQIKRIISYR